MAALPHGFDLRRAHPADVEAVAALEAAVFPDPWPARLYAQEVAQPLRFQRVVTWGSGPIAAYLFACWQADELHVLKVATAPEFQRQGLATTLLAEAHSEVIARRGRGLILEVRPTNTRAIRLYSAIGFRVVSRRPHYYSDGEDALVMFQPVTGSPTGP